MPLFDTQCNHCNNQVSDVLMSYEESWEQFCVCCNTWTIWETLPPLVAMHPDNMWSGVNTQQGYFTSKEQHLSYLKNNSLHRVERGMVEEVKKKAKNRVPEQLKKNEKNLEKFLGKELASM